MPIPKIKYSSSSDEQTSANSASSEVDSHESWTPNKHDSNPYLQFEFTPGNTVIGIQIKGKEEKNEWVTKFTISYSVDGIVWIPLNKIFDGNSEEHKETIIFFDQSIPSNAAYVRVYPVEYHGHISLFAQLLQDCLNKTTTEAPTTPTPTPTVKTTTTTTPCYYIMPIPKIKYSSSSDEQTSANSASSEVDSHESWTPNKHDSNPYLQFEFTPGNTVIGIQIKGKEEKNEWVTKFTISYSVDGIVWIPLNKIFDGNSEEHKETIIFFDQSIPSDAAYVRVYPVEYHGHISLLAQLLQDCLNKTTTEAPTTPTPTPTVKTTTTTTPCYYIMPIPKIKYSSSSDEQTSANSASSEVDSHESWTPNKHDSNPYLQFEFTPGNTVIGIQIKGKEEKNEWVTKFTISYSVDGIVWIPLNKIFDGNSEEHKETIIFFDQSIPSDAAYVRVYPVEYHGHISLLAQLLQDCLNKTTTEAPTTPTPTPTVKTTTTTTRKAI
ncbi:lactadherin-like [Lethenteron reissneri]|uniref:lactadherin-like n=1 Tax=Lethenteron reissneri TaxID=7753 RepID=UPI002AB7E56B|nr:lactadherin-like [Lethenteron reissneri]